MSGLYGTFGPKQHLLKKAALSSSLYAIYMYSVLPYPIYATRRNTLYSIICKNRTSNLIKAISQTYSCRKVKQLVVRIFVIVSCLVGAYIGIPAG
jgi:hypothetical protein